MAVVPMNFLHDLDRQMKDFRRELPQKKDKKRTTVDPADMAEALHDSIRSIVKLAVSIQKKTQFRLRP